MTIGARFIRAGRRVLAVVYSMCVLATLAYTADERPPQAERQVSNAVVSSEPSQTEAPGISEGVGQKPHRLCLSRTEPESISGSLQRIAPDLACQQLRIWSFPFRAAMHPELLAATLGLAGVTTGLVVADPALGHYFRNTNRFDSFNKAVMSPGTKYAIMAVPISFYAASLLRRDPYGQQTAILAGEALLNAELLTKAGKLITRRQGPSSIPPNGDFQDTWFTARNGSFPSGHAAGAFSVATIFATRYRNHKWVPFVAYGLAGAVGVATMTSSGHFPSEVFLGSAIGYASSRFAVLR
jgi:membrane-associated phospholipid phosphatase